MFLYELITAAKMLKARIREIGGEEDDYYLKYSECEVSVQDSSSQSVVPGQWQHHLGTC